MFFSRTLDLIYCGDLPFGRLGSSLTGFEQLHNLGSGLLRLAITWSDSHFVGAWNNPNSQIPMSRTLELLQVHLIDTLAKTIGIGLVRGSSLEEGIQFQKIYSGDTL